MPQASDEMTVSLSIAEWNQLLMILTEGPYKIVAPLLAKIQAQAPPPNGSSVEAASGDTQHVSH